MPPKGPPYSQVHRPPKLPKKDFGRSRTRQSEANAADINQIMQKYVRTGIIPVSDRQGFFADVSQMGDYRTAMDNVMKADKFFMQLPAEVRAKFDNDPAKFLDVCADESRRDELVELGLLEKPGEEPAPEAPAEAPPETPVVE